MILRITLATAFALLLVAQTAQANTPPPLGEYDTVPPGLLLSPEQRAGLKNPTTAQPKTEYMLDPQVLTHSLSVLEKKPTQDADAAKIISMQQIEEAYAKGNYADILVPLQQHITQNEPTAALLMGIMYDAGQGVTANPARATELFARAAEANIPQAQHRLALQYYQGRSGTKDTLRAMMWLHIAAATYREGPQKDRAIADRNNLDASLSRRDRDTALFMAREWMTKKGILHLLEAQQPAGNKAP